MSQEKNRITANASNIEVSMNTIVKKEELQPFKFE
jgi:hypothetical protein